MFTWCTMHVECFDGCLTQKHWKSGGCRSDATCSLVAYCELCSRWRPEVVGWIWMFDDFEWFCLHLSSIHRVPMHFHFCFLSKKKNIISLIFYNPSFFAASCTSIKIRISYKSLTTSPKHPNATLRGLHVDPPGRRQPLPLRGRAEARGDAVGGGGVRFWWLGQWKTCFFGTSIRFYGWIFSFLF